MEAAAAPCRHGALMHSSTSRSQFPPALTYPRRLNYGFTQPEGHCGYLHCTRRHSHPDARTHRRRLQNRARKHTSTCVRVAVSDGITSTLTSTCVHMAQSTCRQHTVASTTVSREQIPPFRQGLLAHSWIHVGTHHRPPAQLKKIACTQARGAWHAPHVPEHRNRSRVRRPRQSNGVHGKRGSCGGVCNIETFSKTGGQGVRATHAARKNRTIAGTIEGSHLRRRGGVGRAIVATFSFAGQA